MFQVVTAVACGAVTVLMYGNPPFSKMLMDTTKYANIFVPYSLFDGTFEAVTISPQYFSRKSAPMCFLPTLGNVREYVIVQHAAQITVAQAIVRSPAPAHEQVAHLTVKHGQCRWRMLD